MQNGISAEEQWRMLVMEGRTTKERERLSHLYAVLPAPSRCRICNVPFAGWSGQVMRFLGKAPSNLNPHLCKSDAIIDKLAGDQVSGYYVPGLAGPAHARAAILAAHDLLQVTGHDDPKGPWIPVGVGVHTGDAFIGSVGAQDGVVDVTALGDSVNVAARLASSAGPGEILVSQDTFIEAGLIQSNLEQRKLSLKGRIDPVTVFVLSGIMPVTKI